MTEATQVRQFISTEKVSEKQSNIQILLRFVSDLKAFRYLLIPSLFITAIGSVLPQLFLFWVGKITECTQGANCSVDVSFLDTSYSFHLGPSLFFLIFTICFIGKIISFAAVEIGGQWSTQAWHKKMMLSVAGVRTTYFDENPSGRLLNKMASDYSKVRLHCISYISDVQFATLDLLCIAIIISLAHPIPALTLVPILFIYLRFQSYFAPMQGHARELHSIAKGEILNRQTDLIEGVEAFRLFGKVERLHERIGVAYRKLIDVELLSARLSAWGQFWMNMTSSSYAIFVYGAVVYSLYTGAVTKVYAAIIISILLALEGNILWVSLVIKNLSNAAAHIRRIYSLIDLVPEEKEEGKVPAAELGQTMVEPKSEVQAQEIEFKDYSMSYRYNSPLVLNELSLKIPAKQHVGLIGRTGSGKSSLIQALFRMVYVQNGDVLIDGRSIFCVEAAKHRKLFGMVPQDPYLFSGTLRFNLQCSHETTNDVRLREIISILGLPFGLDHEVEEGGKNFSLGERQLISLGRVLFSKRPYVILDEPTSSVDNQTDEKIQSVIKEHLVDRTVITVAHRTETFKNYDKLYELNNGELIWEGSYQEFLKR